MVLHIHQIGRKSVSFRDAVYKAFVRNYVEGLSERMNLFQLYGV